MKPIYLVKRKTYKNLELKEITYVTNALYYFTKYKDEAKIFDTFEEAQNYAKCLNIGDRVLKLAYFYDYEAIDLTKRNDTTLHN